MFQPGAPGGMQSLLSVVDVILSPASQRPTVDLPIAMIPPSLQT